MQFKPPFQLQQDLLKLMPGHRTFRLERRELYMHRKLFKQSGLHKWNSTSVHGSLPSKSVGKQHDLWKFNIKAVPELHWLVRAEIESFMRCHLRLR